MIALVFVLIRSSSKYSYRVPGPVLGAETREETTRKLIVTYMISSNKVVSSPKRVFSVAFTYQTVQCYVASTR